MRKNKTYHRKKTVLLWVLCMGMMVGLAGRLVYLCVFRSVYYSEKADDLHERERGIKAARGRILDANGEVLAANRTVCTISVIHSQIEEPEAVIAMLVKELGISEETARKRVEKRSSIERVKTNVDKKTGDTIRSYGYAGVKVDEDFKRYYPKGKLASRVIGFTGGDNQGIIGLEVEYEEILKGINGKILTTTDARGIEIENAGETRLEPVKPPGAGGGKGLKGQPGCQYPGVLPAGSGKGDGRKTGGQRLDSSYESAERRNLCLCQCAGVRPQRSVHAAAGYNGTFGKRNSGSAEPDVAECLHQRYVRAGIYL